MENLVILATAPYSNFLDLFVLILVFIAIIVACYFSTKFVSKTGLNLQHAKNIKVLEVFRLNQNHSLYIVKMGDKVMSLGVTKDHIEFLSDLNEESLDFTPPEKMNKSFKEILKMHKGKKEE